jgi:hypothetical protein
MAKRRVRPGPRSLIALVLIGFVLVTAGVILRRVYGLEEARKIRDLTSRRDALNAERVRLEGSIREASSRKRLQPIVEQRLNMHIAQPIFITRPPRPAVVPQ